MDRVTLTWENKNNDLDAHQRIKSFFEDNHLICEETKGGLYITCNNEEKAFLYMWSAMYELAKNEWFRDTVKSCVWKDGREMEDVIKSTEGLFVDGKIQLDKIFNRDKEEEEDEDVDEITITWKDNNNDLDVHQRIKEYCESKQLNCEEMADGLYITYDDKKKAFSQLWIVMMDLAECSWFRKAVKSCVWRCGWEWEDIIISTAELIEEGEMCVHD